VRLLRREVELPLRRYERAGFYLGLASLLLCLFILLDAALWARSASIAIERGRLERPQAADARLRPRRPCVQPARVREPGEYHDQLMEQLEHTWATADDFDAGQVGRYGKMTETALDDGVLVREPSPALRKTRIVSPHRDPAPSR
jgi:hypothetical protein